MHKCTKTRWETGTGYIDVVSCMIPILIIAYVASHPSVSFIQLCIKENPSRPSLHCPLAVAVTCYRWVLFLVYAAGMHQVPDWIDNA